MKVPARRIAPQRPARFPRLLPRGEPEGQLEEQRNALEPNRLRRNRTGHIEIAIGARKLIGTKGQLDPFRSLEDAKWIGLRRPVHVTRGARVPMKVVFRTRVVGK